MCLPNDGRRNAKGVKSMRNMLLRDMKRGFCSIAYWLCVFSLIVMGVISLKVNLNYYPLVLDAGGLTIFLHATALSLGGIFNAIAPIACIIPFSLSYLDDMQTANVQYQLTRMKPRKYFVTRIISSSVVSGSVFLSTYVIMILLAVIYSPVPSFRIDISPLVIFRTVYDRSLWGFIAVYALNSFLFGCTYSLLAVGISAVSSNRFLAIGLPAVFYHVSILIAWLFPKNMVYDIVHWLPYESFSLQTNSVNRLISAHITILLVGLSLYLYGVWRYRLNGRI